MYLGIDIGGTKCAVILGDDEGNIVKKVRFETTDVNSTIDRIIEESVKMGEVKAVGISCGGPLDSKKGIIMSPPNLPGWDDIHITEMLEEKLGVPVYLCNDANACALAEWKFGAGKGSNNMVFLTFGTGLGAGLILDGKLYAGTNDMAGEVGHMRLENHGPVGYGKSGSFEGFCSGGGIAQLGKTMALEKLQQGISVAYCETINDLEAVTAKTIAEAAEAGDETAINVYKVCGEKLGAGLSVIIDILNPEVIVIGSIFARSENLLRKYAEEVIRRESLSLSNKVCRVEPALLGEKIGDVAALSVAMNGGE